jgi:hypothetical protein
MHVPRSQSRDSSSRRRGVAALRAIGFAVGAAFGVVAIWLIVTSTNDAKRVEIGVLLGLWGLFLGAISVFGSKSSRGQAAAAAAPGQELDLRQLGEIERVAVANAVAAARRDFQAELEQMLQRTVQVVLAQEVAGLRDEVAALRNELVEKVGGQLRLERIETTRLIGSDLEALQQELRQLREIGGTRDGESADSSTAEVEVHEAEIVVERIHPPQPEPEPAAAPEPAAPAPPVAAEPEPAPPVAPEPAPEPVPVASSDPFASMPRIRPFTDFELDPTPVAAANGEHGDDGADRSARHATGEDAASSRGRRHRADDDNNDVLARILARESRH